jgi:hypothetical protein
VHVIGLLDASKDKVANIEGSFLNVAIMIVSKLLVVTSLSHDGDESLLLKVVEIDATCLFGLSFLVELDSQSSEGNISR